MVINKPAGMVVHPARGHWSGTLAGALQFHFGPTLSQRAGSRPGIVHRLDRDTSGVIVVARNDQAHSYLGSNLPPARSKRSISPWWPAARPRPRRDRPPIGFHPPPRENGHRRAGRRPPAGADVLHSPGAFRRFRGGRAAAEDRPDAPIRVHLGHIGCPVLCDRQYGGRSRITRGEIRRDPADETVFASRQALHARRLSFLNPATGQRSPSKSPLPPDIVAVLEELRQWRAKRD